MKNWKTGLCLITIATLSILPTKGSRADSIGESGDPFLEEWLENLVIIPKHRIPDFQIVTKPVIERKNLILVPRRAVTGEFVFLKALEIPNAYFRQNVKLGKIEGDLVAVELGLFPGDEIVISKIEGLCKLLESPEISPRKALDLIHGHVCDP